MSIQTRSLAVTAALLAAGTPLPAVAQDTSAAASEMAERLSDPVEQQRMATTLSTVSEILLSMPIAPLAEALEEATGEEIADIDHDTTLRSLAGPGADEISPQIERNVPRVMGAMAGMANGMQAMLPALREMADRMRDALPARAD